MPNFAPIVKAGAKGVEALVDALRAFKYPQEEAMLLAQQRAALPLEKGGLGLPATNTAAERAAAMGFDTPAYHATGTDFAQFRVNPYRGASFFSDTPQGALKGAKAGAGDRIGYTEINNVMPVIARSDDVYGLTLTKDQQKWFNSLPKNATEQQVVEGMTKGPKQANWNTYFDEVQLPDGTFSYVKKEMPSTTYQKAAKTRRDVLGHEIADYADATNERFMSEISKNAGKKGFVQNDESGLALAITNPEAIRSRFAAFDPWRKTAATAAAMGVAAPDLLAEELRKK